MPRTSDKDRVKSWQKKIAAADKYYKKWEEKFRCKMLEEYWEGKQWEDQPAELAQEHYTINMVFPSIEIKIPSLLFYHPIVKIRPRPTRSDDTQSMAEERAKLQEDTVNTLIQDRRLGFKFETTMALRESFFRFGVVEVGYTADIIDNPMLQKPELTEEEQGIVKSVPQIVQNESVYVKRIPADQFRVSVSAKNQLGTNDWIGYWEEHFIDDVKANPRYKNTASLKRSGTINREYATDTDPEDMDEEGHAKQKDTLRIWKIWDLRSKTKKVFAENGEKFFMEEPFDYLPFAIFKQYERRTDFYPLPPVYNWLHPQNEKNEIREMKRVHRKRFYRRYLVQDGAIDDRELEKLESGGDGVYAKANRVDAIAAVPDAPLDRSIEADDALAEQAFNNVSGVGNEWRGDTDPDVTATQANIVDVRSRIRESYLKTAVGDWLGEIAWLMLKTIKDKMALPFWININTDPLGPAAMQEAMEVAVLWQQITAENLGEIEYDISVDLQSLSPISNEMEAQRWMQVLGLMGNPQLCAVLLGSDTLLRKTVGYFGIRSDKEITEIKKGMMAIMAMLAAAAAQKAGVGGAQGGGAQGPPQPGAQPSNEQIAQQIQAQIQ